MPFSIFKDFDKPAADLIEEDFDSKFSLKVKSAGPFGATLTTTTNVDTKDSKLSPKLSLKWPHESGFTLEKFESTHDGKLAVETSLVGVAPGLKLEFKGNDSSKSDLSFTYTAPAATVTGELDLVNLSSVKASVNGGNGPVTVGATAEVKLAKSAVESYNLGVGLGYTVPKLFVGVRADKNFSAYSALVTYNAADAITLAGKVTYTQKDNANAILAGVYKCNANTTVKVKANTNGGVFSSSVKQTFPGKFAVVGSVEIPAQLNSAKFGLNATLG
mmetsp:Transcript_835/g.483  ORF Transcript_835/g.483 Transcript_835/m.483 type:complete len:274 (-) Transcript_835:102-923(-)|eukprot:CAMPEP_0202970604 /NCGR_PEP_ID=MMETSP1396-20130829/18173_1 /ASSEMBLY_ACC=CAM_ASM_000872 /TAXON_ID= /ORGANISM="Pseudokeronopsis sp., Strain Brazil" /LENGTH=273 /DNA_ID=CAMNT_0049699215 /DNA_START=26 /DNA_END=847 /DNA_ORIENTATION=+